MSSAEIEKEFKNSGERNDESTLKTYEIVKE